MNKTLCLIRGLPGAGKSTFAKEFSERIEAYWFETDDWFVNQQGEYVFRPDRLKEAHEECQVSTERVMQLTDDPIVVSNTFTTEKELKPYLDLAAKYDYQVVSLIVENRHGNKSEHNVPETTIQKMKDRFSIKL